MKHTLVVLAAPNAPAEFVVRALAQRGAVIPMGFDLWSMLERLREGTQHRAQVWQGVGAKPAEWIDPAVAHLAQVFVETLAKRVRLARNAPDSFVALWSPNAAPHAVELSRMLPAVRWLSLLSDGRIASVADELAGFEHAEAWARATAPMRTLAAEVGERMLSLRCDDLERDVDASLRAVEDWLGFRAAANAPSSGLGAQQRLQGAALAGFAAHPRAEALMRELGYAVALAPWTHLPSPVAARRARVLLELGRIDEADEVVTRSAPSADISIALGGVRQRQGRDDDAAAAFVHALRLDATAWEAAAALFDASRPESLALASFARAHPDVRVRSALARWLVRRGLDAEAAEIVASVEHQAWR